MAEPTLLTPEEIAALQSELETLRNTNADLVAKHAKDKSTIQQLQSDVTGLQGRLTASEAAYHDATAGASLRNMANSISTAPGLWIQEFSKQYKVETVDGKLTLLHAADGKPVLKDGKPVPFQQKELTDLLTSGDDEQSNAFRTIIITSRASGAQSITDSIRRPASPTKQPVKFGLR